MRLRTPAPYLFAFLVALITVPGPAFAALHLVMRPVGINQGVIQGNSTATGYADWIDVASFQHGVGLPAGTNGIPDGYPSVSELTLSGQFDRSSVKLMKALNDKEQLTSFTMELSDDNMAKMSTVLIRIELIGGYVTSFSQSSAGDIPSYAMSFSYSQIIITDVQEGTSVTYNWTPPLSSGPEEVSKNILFTPTPNPTHGQTQFSFNLPADSNAHLRLYDIRGRLVKNVYSGWTSDESTMAVWDGTDEGGKKVAQGVYMVRLTYPGHEYTQRITVLR